MKKLLSISLLALCAAIPAHAQFNLIGQSEIFKEPEEGFGKIILEKNGNTAFLHLSKDGEVNVQIFDPAHKAIGNTLLEPAVMKDGNKRAMEIKGCFEIGGNITVLFTKAEDKVPTLCRLIIDGKSGKLIEETIIGTLERFGRADGYAVAYGKVPMPDFYVRKDMNSDNYAVALFNTTVSDRNKRIQIIHYNSKNKELSRAFYQIPNDEYKYNNYLDMCVVGDESVKVAIVSYNTKSSGGNQQASLLLGTLPKGSTEFAMQNVRYPEPQNIKSAMMRYNPATKMMALVTLQLMETRGGTMSYLAVKSDISTEDFEISMKPIGTSMVNKIAKDHYGKKNGFMAMPQNIFINADGSYAILYEEITEISNGRVSQTYLGDVGVVYYNADNEETNAAYIPKNHQLYYEGVGLMYYSDREDKAQVMAKGNQYKFFCFLDGKKQDYILMNELESNQERIDRKKTVNAIGGVGDMQAFSFPVGSNATIPARQKIFAGEKDRSLALFTISDYDRDKNIYCTLRLTKDHGNKVQLVWIEPK